MIIGFFVRVAFVKLNALSFTAWGPTGDELASGGENIAGWRGKGLLVVFWWLVHLKCRCDDVVKESKGLKRRCRRETIVDWEMIYGRMSVNKN